MTPIEQFEVIISRFYPGFTVPERQKMDAASSGKTPSTDSTCPWTVRQKLLRTVVKILDEILQMQVDGEYYNSLRKNPEDRIDLSDNQASWNAANKSLVRIALCQNCEIEWDELMKSLAK